VILEDSRIGDHICYYSDLRKIRSHYPNWDVSISLPAIVEEIVEAWKKRLASQALVT
jgi:CDP-paratose 2-epimerase